jgi:hypothetical protein
MELDWSEQSPHIRTLFRPWQPGDGCDEATLQAAEARLGIRFPLTLRNFCLAWGHRRDLTRKVHPLLPPDELQFRDDALVFWAENQAVVLWGIRHEHLEEAAPPVVEAWNLDEGLEWTPSHVRLLDFLDDLTYEHALSGGALYWGWSVERVQTQEQTQWLEDHWRKARVGRRFSYWTPDDEERSKTLYIREGQAVCWNLGWWSAAANSQEALDEIAQALQITWEPYDGF